ncbi:PTS N-acetylglucosamine transporter subunit IIBC [Lactobacillus sp. ESL0791]|uniref:PTS sugar transporter subunit IIA n=1 Tax=Lactobacillus sp. ESL0791 TaxID=2983234 RepID=UPI0023FA0CB0|nr:PTS N-acetylglucosamine transporter subunit IIBC [Lactobacillus sp. ESL0791]MDF7638040.1 PTS N-acetylglucosamine transporter subunit IIBC [Lactobacillus sp. ESL0791]
MKKVIIVTHKSLAEGFKDSLNFFTGVNDQIVAISAYEDNNVFPEKQLADELKNSKPEDKIIILTDMLGGSVNQHASRYIDKNIYLITGINLSIALEIVLLPEEKVSNKKIEEMVKEARKQLVFVNNYLKQNKADYDDE